ncbi:MAG: hypothetical protein ACHQHN_00340 [Sphingobacteriales bacterium]
MKTLIVLAGVLFFWVSTVEAQVVVDAKTTTADKTASTAKSTATGTSTATKSTIKKNTTAKSTAKTASHKSKFDADRSVNQANATANKSITKTNDAVNKTSQTANNATDLLSSTASKAKDLVHKIIPPKQPAAGTVSNNTTDIIIKGGLTFAALNKLNDNVHACPGVQSATMKFSSSKSTITVSHSGTTADLLKQIEARSSDVFSDANVSDFKEGKISIKLKSN